VWAACFNFLALFLFGFGIAATIGEGIVNPLVVDTHVIFGALLAAIAWNIATWYHGIPSSSSHALIGGMIGASFAKAGTGALVSSGITWTMTFLIVAPLMGFAFGALLMKLMSLLFQRFTPYRADKWFRRGQLVSCALYSLGHGSNDAQKTVGIVWLLFIISGVATRDVKTLPYWVVVACYAAISIGTLFGGWRIVKTMGQRITKLKPIGGFCAETGGAITLFIASSLGVPVSTTHTITGAIVGVGAARKLSAVRWGVAGNIVWVWVFTIPVSAVVAAMGWWIGKAIF
jgi:inorganic phosphate transporter, PiT family